MNNNDIDIEIIDTNWINEFEKEENDLTKISDSDIPYERRINIKTYSNTNSV